MLGQPNHIEIYRYISTKECNSTREYLPQAPTTMKATKNTMKRMRQITSVQLLYIAQCTLINQSMILLV